MELTSEKLEIVVKVQGSTFFGYKLRKEHGYKYGKIGNHGAGKACRKSI